MEERAYTPDIRQAQTKILLALAEALKELKEVPDGIFYAQTMTFFPSLEAYNSYIDVLINAEMVKRQGNILYWIDKG